MDFQRFFKLLKRFTWILVLVPILAATITYFLVLDLPKEYSSQALISTGLADQSQQIAMSTNQMDYYAVNQQFSNIIEYLTMKKNINMLSYKLMLHDLENPESAFTEIPDFFNSLNSKDQSDIINEYKKFLAEEKILTPDDNKKYDLFDIVQTMGYGEKTITEQLEITRKDNSDFIQIEYLSSDPYLSVYVVNTIADDFIHSYKERTNRNQNSSKELLDSLLKGKEESMNAKNSQVKDFQVKNSAINLVNQADVLYSQISEKESQRAAAVGEIRSLQGAIQGIDAKLKSRNSELISTNVNENNQIINIKNQLQKANERYVDNNFKAEDGLKIDSLQSRLSMLIASSATSSASDPRVLRQGLIQQKLNMEVELDRAKSGLSVILGDLSQMRGRYNQMVPKDAGMKNFEREADVATKEYLNTLEMYNKNNVLGNTTGIRPQLVQAGVVNPAEPSKQFIYVGMAGISSFATLIFILVIASLLDRKIRNPYQLTYLTQKKVIGIVNKIVPNNKDLKAIWEEGETSTDYMIYKDLLRSLRFEIDRILRIDNKQVIGITGLFENSGSSFISSSLAYSFAMTKKRVLLIGGEYALEKTPDIKEIGTNQFFDSYIVKRELQAEEFITKLTTNSKDESLLEIYNEDVLRNGFDELKKEFDIIIIDVQSLQEIHRAKEWLMFTDKSLAIYPAGKSISNYERDLISFINKQDGFMGWVLNNAKVDDIGLRKMIHAN